ncbi:MAG: glycosyltransferase family 61 protein [Sphingobacteriales bacterium]|nr:glycosyltransferase family 61 protein [Sphingobacteriales bacterium]
MKRTVLYPELTITRKPPPNYEEMHPLKDTFIHLTETFPAVCRLEISNAYVSPFGVVYKNGRVVRESVYSMFKPNSFYLSFFKKRLLNKVVKVSGDCLIAHNSYFQNYYHWLLEAVPRLYVMKEEAPNLTLILNADSPGFIKQYVALFGFKDVSYIQEDYLVKAEKVIFPGYTSRGLAMYEPILRDMAKWITEKFEVTVPAEATKNIFITRKNARYRRLLNEAEVIDYLSGKGFEIVTLEDLTVKEQIALFVNARNVIGTQGAGMSNMIYAVHARLLVTIIHEEHPDDAYFNLTNMYGTDCYYFQCPGAGNFSYKNNDDITADMNKLKAVCEKYIFNSEQKES